MAKSTRIRCDAISNLEQSLTSPILSNKTVLIDSRISRNSASTKVKNAMLFWNGLTNEMVLMSTPVMSLPSMVCEEAVRNLVENTTSSFPFIILYLPTFEDMVV